jgi:hypothetical protein
MALEASSKERITVLIGILLPFSLYLVYNWLLASTLQFEFSSVNTARIVNSTVHTIVWAALGVALHKLLRILWTNLLWKNLDVPNIDGHLHFRHKGCTSETLCWLTSKPFCAVENVFKLRDGHTLAIMAFGMLYMCRNLMKICLSDKDKLVISVKSILLLDEGHLLNR